MKHSITKNVNLLSIKIRLAHYFGTLKLCNLVFKALKKKHYVILMYHRIVPLKEAGFHTQPGMYVDPNTFESQINFLKSNFNILSFSSFINGSKFSEKPICILTFDDGWHDFYKYAYPVIVRYEIPVTLFVPTFYISNNNKFWTDKISSVLLQAQNNKNRNIRSNNKLGGLVVKKWLDTDCNTEYIIEMLKQHKTEAIEKMIDDLVSTNNLDSAADERAFVTWEQLREMSSSGLVEIGSHTHRHWILTNYSEEEVRNDIEMSRTELIGKGLVSSDFIPFCYPNGNFNAHIAQIVRETGFQLAVTTQSGWNRFDGDIFVLKRVGIHEDIGSTDGMFGCRMAGIF
jgi:peptidoglycan/xylan/chitin deacetylase (PgdA/CDA1 family)